MGWVGLDGLDGYLKVVCTEHGANNPPSQLGNDRARIFFNIYIIIIISTIVIIIGTWLCNMAKNIDFKYPGFWGGGPTDNLSLF